MDQTGGSRYPPAGHPHATRPLSSSRPVSSLARRLTLLDVSHGALEVLLRDHLAEDHQQVEFGVDEVARGAAGRRSRRGRAGRHGRRLHRRHRVGRRGALLQQDGHTWRSPPSSSSSPSSSFFLLAMLLAL